MSEEEKQQNEETTEETPETEAAAEEKPKPRRTRKKKAAEPEAQEAAEATAEAEEPADEEKPAADEESEAEEAPAEEPMAEEAPEEEAAAEEAPEEEGTEAKKPSRRRRSADAAAAPGAKKTPAPRAADGTVVVRAQAKYVRHAPRKARLVVDHIRGKSVGEARAILNHTPRAAAVDVLKLLESAVANAENNHELDADELVIRKVYVDEGPTLKRYRPRALGRATRIRKRTSHMTIQLSPKE
jgi:large subunit ribosomal protein L22